jgi:hypothetical protein
MGPGLELLTAVMRHYQQVTGRQLSPGRIMAWHLRQALGDALWHSEAGIPLNDHPDTTAVGRGPGRALQRTRHRPRDATRSQPALMAPAKTGMPRHGRHGRQGRGVVARHVVAGG